MRIQRSLPLLIASLLGLFAGFTVAQEAESRIGESPDGPPPVGRMVVLVAVRLLSGTGG